MKKWYLFFLTIVLIACYDDEGSYSYKELNDVTIGGIIDNDWIILRITTFIIFYKIIGLVLPIILHDLRILENSIIL